MTSIGLGMADPVERRGADNGSYLLQSQGGEAILKHDKTRA